MDAKHSSGRTYEIWVVLDENTHITHSYSDVRIGVDKTTGRYAIVGTIPRNPSMGRLFTTQHILGPDLKPRISEITRIHGLRETGGVEATAFTSSKRISRREVFEDVGDPHLSGKHTGNMKYLGATELLSQEGATLADVEAHIREQMPEMTMPLQPAAPHHFKENIPDEVQSAPEPLDSHPKEPDPTPVQGTGGLPRISAIHALRLAIDDVSLGKVQGQVIDDLIRVLVEHHGLTAEQVELAIKDQTLQVPRHVIEASAVAVEEWSPVPDDGVDPTAATKAFLERKLSEVVDDGMVRPTLAVDLGHFGVRFRAPDGTIIQTRASHRPETTTPEGLPTRPVARVMEKLADVSAAESERAQKRVLPRVVKEERKTGESPSEEVVVAFLSSPGESETGEFHYVGDAANGAQDDVLSLDLPPDKFEYVEDGEHAESHGHQTREDAGKDDLEDR